MEAEEAEEAAFSDGFATCSLVAGCASGSLGALQRTMLVMTKMSNSTTKTAAMMSAIGGSENGNLSRSDAERAANVPEPLELLDRPDWLRC